VSRPTGASPAYPKVPSDGCRGGWVRGEEPGLYGNLLAVLLLPQILDRYRMLQLGASNPREDESAARGQERRHLRGGRVDRWRSCPRLRVRERAKVHLAGRTLESLEEVAGEIRSAGGAAETAQVDAIDEQAVDRHADAVAASAGGIDVSFNLISVGDVQGTPLAEMPLQDFERPVMTAVRTRFLTSRAASRHMIPRGSGVIPFFGGYGDPVPDYYIGGAGAGGGRPRLAPSCSPWRTAPRS